ncbi:DUF7146 domain-containing protein [Photorhabdus heterorhabditis]|uniref:DUF7146 domain-containing protein n=1 Tax=Photorhabdus heterorhabditis TaxID=880156 RepID=UPI001561EFB2|nr:toprim domain-containing protein [Photorhabdus heterorhabditis]NRN29689.1 hypothetical protein [Photorhabdus heterorhabditis subsp. aluminescens]
MTYAVAAYHASPKQTKQSLQELTQELINRVHARIVGVNSREFVFSKIPTFAKAVDIAPNQIPCQFTCAGKAKFRFCGKEAYTGSTIHNDYPVNKFCNGIDILAEFYGLSNYQTCKQILADYFGDDINVPLSGADIRNIQTYQNIVKSSVELTDEEIDKRVRKLEAVYHYTKPVTAGSAVWRYLSKRGFKRVLNKLPKDIGCNPKLYYWDKANEKGIQMPAMVSIYRDNKGKNLTIHRTFLERNGDGAKVDCPKMMMKPSANMIGGAIHLYEPHYDQASKVWTLGVSEGVENALSVVEATSTPCWAASSAWFMEYVEIPDNILPPPNVKAINFYIWADKGRANEQGVYVGLEAALALKTRMTALFEKRFPAAQLTIEVFEPVQPIPEGKKGIDWNDVLLSKGAEGFPVCWASELLDQLK